MCDLLTARLNASSLAFDGFDVPAILRTYCNAASCTSALLAAGSKLCKGLMFRHIPLFCTTARRPSTSSAHGALDATHRRLQPRELEPRGTRCGRPLFGGADRAHARG